MKTQKFRLGLLGASVVLGAFGCKGEETAAVTPESKKYDPPTAVTSQTPPTDTKMAKPETFGMSGAKPGEKPAEATTPPAGTTPPAETKPGSPTENLKAPIKKTASGLQIQDLIEGTGKVAVTGSAVAVHYRGSLDDGTIFDESYKRGEPLTLMLGQGRVIKGWEEGLVGMKEGGKRRLTIPASLGYGDKGQGEIPGGATLHFDCEMMRVK